MSLTRMERAKPVIWSDPASSQQRRSFSTAAVSPFPQKPLALGPVWIIQSCLPLALDEYVKACTSRKCEGASAVCLTVYVPCDPLEWIMLPFMLTVANGLTSVTVSVEVDSFYDGFRYRNPR